MSLQSSATAVLVFTIGLGALSSVGAVYTPTAALTNGTANPCTDSTGATWGFYKSTFSTDPRTPLTGPYTRASGLKGFASNGGAPYLAVNATANPIADSVATGNSSISDPRAIQPGELLMNVLENSNTGKAILRFTPPHAGFFDVSATFRSVNYGGGQVDVRVMRNGGPNGDVLLNKFMLHAKSATPSTAVYTDRLFLTSRESLDFVLGHGDDGIACDGTGLKVEIRDAEYDGVVDTFDAGALLADATTNAPPANPWITPGGTWSWLAAQWNETEFPERRTTLPTGYLRSTGSGYVGMGTTGQLPYVTVNTNTVSVVDGSNRSVAPGEMFIHPDCHTNSLIRFIPSHPGRYRVLYQLRDLSSGFVSDPMRGVRLLVYVNDELISNAYVCLESQIEEVVGCLRLPPVLAGEAIDFCIHNNAQKFDSNANNADATGLRLAVQRLADDALPPVHDFGADFAAEESKASPANPFTSAAGAVWEVGKASSRTGAFTRMTSIRDREAGVLRGWCTSAGATLPALCANISGGIVSGGNAIQSGRYLYPREYWFHPGESEYGLVRYTVPSTGVYRARASFLDKNKEGEVSSIEQLGSRGVDCHLQADTLTVASGYASLEANVQADLDEDRLYLEKDSHITFLIGPNGGNNSDATAARASVMPVGGVPDEQILCIDLKGAAGGAAYAGRGRVGWANASWNAVPAGRLSRALYLADAQTRVATRIAVTNAAQSVTSATGTSPNALVGDGVSSAGLADACMFTITGLVPDALYTLYLYGTKGSFTVGDTTVVPTRQVFTPFAKEVAEVQVAADETGTLAGTFCAATDGVTAVFGGLQIVGTAFPAYVEDGTLVIIR